MKPWWGYAAVALAFGFVAGRFVLAERGPTVERLSSKETMPGIEVPVIGTVGDFPDPAHRHVVNVFADGRIVVEGNEISLSGLTDSVREWGALSSVRYTPFGRRIADAEPDQEKQIRLSGEHAVFRIDGSLSWSAALRVMGSTSAAKILHVWIVVRHERDGAEGALSFPTTLDGEAFDPGGSVRINDKPTYGVDVLAGQGGGSPQLLYEGLRAIPTEGDRGFELYLRVGGAMHVSTVVSLWDAALRAKSASLSFDSRGDDRERSYEALVAGRDPDPSAYSLWLVDAPALGAIDRSPMPAVGRVRGAAITCSPWMYSPSWDRAKRTPLTLPK